MKKIIVLVAVIAGFILGLLFAGIAISVSAGEMMVKEFISPYDFDKTIDVMINRINSKDGWRVTNIIDQNKEITENGGSPIGPFKIIKYCHANYSSRMLNTDERKKIGNMMPKSFAVYQKSDGQVYISTMNGAIMGKILGGEIEAIIEEVSLEVEDMMQFINIKYSLF